jgi:hypothetical protein
VTRKPQSAAALRTSQRAPVKNAPGCSLEPDSDGLALALWNLHIDPNTEGIIHQLICGLAIGASPLQKVDRRANLDEFHEE